MLPNHNHREHPAIHVLCQVEALLLCIAAAGAGMAGFVAALPLAWSVASCLFGSGLLLSLRRASTSSRWNRFGTMLLMWFVPLLLSVLGWMDPRLVNMGESWRSGIWMFFAGLGGFLFIVTRVTANRVGERSLPVLERLLASPDRRLRLLALRCAQAPGAPALPAALLSRAHQDPDGYVREEARRLGPR